MKKYISKVLFFAMVAVLALIFISPFMVMLLTSFKTNNDAFTIPVRLFPREWVKENYPAAFAAIPYFKYMGNTVFITAISLIGQLLVTPMVAYSLVKIRWKGADIISGLVMATMMIPITVTMVPLYKIYSKLGLTNTYVPLILPAFFGKAYYIVIVRQFFAGIPNSLIEAGKIDGATEFQRYYKIALPLCKPVLTTIGIYAFLDAWSDYLYPLIFITKPSMYTLSLGLQQYMSEYSIDWSRLMAAAVVFVLPVIVCFAVFQKNFVEGIATSGLKA
ncbi:multiple sugar transport system permease protein [Lacrimispora sphenoides]|jgi:multiple sugar transport system permease protein|uniref:carbohydrate ABC transporter permease n=1 Tax=Lacrimispora sphenoides TaxID=29370 RepID=UPI0008CA17E0|nr:carbohydrate ABC transporter permease [Lacrimispora sphenoides]SEU05497.1 multiple sugar transport system permease protein [Lacrimispora sphenoides]